ncbi:hypothetical protein [Actinomadura rudentiformis]|uniref:Uncharacterized protein n=1 Tax=Actinomadura rudentiformis TaxID=359158 RepID=A0A6H9YNG5_9ACTN|nr:hypothetical protein [Actinomadura rudentiformis]KAB2346357.1 hypothetical protein F8566_23055 [Actinomadura rudentiformis]
MGRVRTAGFIVAGACAGVWAAVVTIGKLAESWSACRSELGGRFALTLLSATALLVMPMVAAAVAALAAGARAAFRGSRLGPILGASITVLGAVFVLLLAVGWIAVGVPPAGYCDAAHHRARALA